MDFISEHTPNDLSIVGKFVDTCGMTTSALRLNMLDARGWQKSVCRGALGAVHKASR